MKNFLLGTVALVALGVAAPAVAADLSPRTYTKAPAYVAAPIYNWTGFYIGGHVGGSFSGNNNFSGGGEDGKFLGGVQVGGDYQFAPNWVFGVEGQYSWSDNSHSRNIYGYSRTQDGLASVTGRLGYTWGPALLYVKGGYAYADYSDNFDSALLGRYSTSGGSKDGYTVGGGLEYLFSQNWSGKVEYQYYNFGKTDFRDRLISIGSIDHDQHTVKAGLNYRFNTGGPLLGKY